MKSLKKKIATFMVVVAMVFTMVPPMGVQAATYKKGSKGTAVQYLQQNLSFLGFSTGGVDGSFGNNTKSAVMKLQKTLHLEESGVVDEELNKLIQGTVADIQSYLAKKGYYNGAIDGIKGTTTGKAFKKLQKEMGYAQTAIVSFEILKEILEDDSVDMEMASLRECVARYENTYSENISGDNDDRKETGSLKLAEIEVAQGMVNTLSALIDSVANNTVSNEIIYQSILSLDKALEKELELYYYNLFAKNLLQNAWRDVGKAPKNSDLDSNYAEVNVKNFSEGGWCSQYALALWKKALVDSGFSKSEVIDKLFPKHRPVLHHLM